MLNIMLQKLPYNADYNASARDIMLLVWEKNLFIYLFIQHLLARPKTAKKHERSGDSQPRQAKREKKKKKKKDAVREGKEIGREKEREAH